MKRDRDGSIEHLLRDALAAPATPGPRTTCLSAEIAAAFVEDALNPVERSAAVAHAAGCARCQSLLAALARTSPPTVSGSWWRLPSVGWLVPLSAAAAAGVVVWAVLPVRSRPQQSSLPARSARLEVSAPVGLSPVPPADPRQLAAQPERRANRQAAAASASTAIAAAPPPASGRYGVEREKQARRQDAAASGPAATAALPPPPAGNSQGAGQERPAATRGNNAAASTPERFAGASIAPAPAQPAAAPSARDGSASLVRVQTPGRRTATLALAEKLTVTPTEIVSPDVSSRWRIVPGGAVQRSFDGGSTWQVQGTGMTVTLTAGASPSPSVCWLVGPNGTVLLSIDGRAWRRVAFPEMADLVSVRATDERTSTVTASDGRIFSTKDGGLTWARSPA